MNTKFRLLKNFKIHHIYDSYKKCSIHCSDRGLISNLSHGRFRCSQNIQKKISVRVFHALVLNSSLVIITVPIHH